MSIQSTGHGFTIVEVMLVLAVTGLMLVGVFVGANAQIATQRYHDSVTSLQADLQNEYSQALSVANDRSPGACPTGAAPLASSRGADANCMILGRLISGDKDTITSTPVIATNSSGQPTDSLATGNWQLYADPSDASVTDKYTLKWGSAVKAITGGIPSDVFSALIVVSPSNGTIQTYVDPTNGTQTAMNLLNQGNAAIKKLDLCVTNGFGVFSGSLLAVRIDAGANGGGSVEVPKQSDNICQGIS